MKYHQVLLFQYGDLHRTFYSNVKHGGIGIFIIFYSRRLLILHCSCLIAKSGNVINTTMGSQILKYLMSKTFTLFTVYFRHTILSDYRCSVRIHKIAGPNPGPFSRRLKMSLCQPSSGWLPFLFWVIEKNEAAKREKLAPYFIC